MSLPASSEPLMRTVEACACPPPQPNFGSCVNPRVPARDLARVPEFVGCLLGLEPQFQTDVLVLAEDLEKGSEDATCIETVRVAGQKPLHFYCGDRV